MDHFTDEKNIIEFFQFENSTSIFFPVFNSDLRLVFSSIYKRKNWKKWINSCGKNDPPPDFYNKDLQFMMDVMRIDDHEYISPKGKVVNEERKLESQAFADIKKDEQFKDFQPSQIFVDIHSDLPTDEDHNFTRYKESFWRTIENHKKKIPNYKKKHLGYKVIFFVFDESSAYCETVEKYSGEKKKGILFEGRPHIPFVDKEFLKIMDNSEIDYLIWYAPYKKINLGNGNVFDMPKAAIYSRLAMNFQYLTYDYECMVSVEV